jgi:signal transduction histidine kinase
VSEGKAETKPENIHVDDGSGESDLIARVLSDVTAELMRRESTLASSSGLDEEFHKQAESILYEALSAVRGDAPPPSHSVVAYGEAAGMARTGSLRASQSHHPAESLMAAEALFHVALPLFVAHSEANTEESVIECAQTLHHAVWRRFPRGAVAYTETLRQRISMANQESRRDVARDLHDRVSHNLAACIQRIELGVLEFDPAQVGQHFDAAISILRTALSDVQSISFDLRQQVGSDYLDEAIQKYVDNVVGAQADVTVISSGVRRRLIPAHAEEVFMIVIEAIRNHRRHAGPRSTATISLTWTDRALRVRVSDDGRGLPEGLAKVDSFGLIGMKERAQAVGASLVVNSSPSGTQIDIVLPLSIGPTN